MRHASILALCALGLLLLTAPPETQADPNDPNLRLGAMYFDQAIAYINDGKKGINKVARFFCDLEDVQIDDVDPQKRETHQEGYLRLWFEQPDKFRQEWRQTRELKSTTTKVLNGNQLWVIQPNGTRKRIHGTSGGAAAVAQLQNDRKKLADLSTFLTLEGLKGPGVTFRYEGVTEGSGRFEGDWLKVRRQLDGKGDMLFYIAYETDAKGVVLRATWPGSVTIPGSKAKGERTEWYILKRWKKGAQFRFPGEVEAWGQHEGQPKPTRFLYAWPRDIRINPIVDASWRTLFRDPTTP